MCKFRTILARISVTPRKTYGKFPDMRCFGSPPLKNTHYTPRPGAYAVIMHGDQVLLTEQSRPAVEIQLPGGGIDPGEGPIQALHREIFEETGWRVTVERKLGAYRRFTYMPEYDLHAMKIAHIYLCTATLHIGDPTEPFHKAILADASIAADLPGPSGDRYFLNRYLRFG